MQRSFHSDYQTSSNEAVLKAQKSQKERLRREKENDLVSKMKHFLLEMCPANSSKLEKADILEQTVQYIYNSRGALQNAQRTAQHLAAVQSHNAQLQNEVAQLKSLLMLSMQSSPPTCSRLVPSDGMDSSLLSPSGSTSSSHTPSPLPSHPSPSPSQPSRKRQRVWQPWE